MGQQSLTIVVVEDEPLILMSLSDTLRDMGHTVFAAADGESALNWIGVHPSTDILITDINLPGMTGRELVKEARKLVPDLRVIYSSSYHPYIEPRLSDDLLTRFLRKPYGPEALLDALNWQLP